MFSRIKVHASNQMEILAAFLKESLFADSRAFTRRLVVVPSPVMRSWILWQLANDPDLSVAMGIEMTYLNRVVGLLSQRFPEKSQKMVPSQLEMSLAVEHEIMKIVDEKDKSPLWLPLNRYLHTNSSLKTARRQTKLSMELAGFFMQYGLYAGAMTEEWKKRGPKDWQEALFLRVFENHPQWTTPSEELKTYFHQTPEAGDIQVHLFGMNFLSGWHHRFFQSVSQVIPVHYYLLSPCEQYWGDASSDSELRQIRKQWRKSGMEESRQLELEEYFQDRHILLANLGRLGRKMMLQIEEDCDEGEFLHAASSKETLLSRLQNEMLHLETSNQNIDTSIQVHAAPTKHREVQILYNNLMHQIEANGWHPNDIIVMAPDITDYAPFIKAVFDNPDQPLDFQIYDLKMSSQSSVVQGFQSLLQIAESRWDAISLMQFLECPGVMRKMGFSVNDRDQLHQWITDTRIRWGSDAQHRQELLGVDEGGAASRFGTWDYGIERLLLGLIMDPDDDHPVVPYEAVEMSQSALLEKLITIICSLREDLKPLSENRKQTLHQWSLYLRCLYEAYFYVDQKDEDSQREEKQLLSLFERFHVQSDGRFSWTTIHAHLDRAFSEQTMNFRESHAQAVKFCSMLPMRAIPAKVVALIGMEDDAYPKKDIRSPLDKMTGRRDVDYVPGSKDFDRYLFLEALLSARDVFLISYTQDTQEKKPSLLVSELINALNETPETFITKHPFSSVHRKYFENQDKFYNYSRLDYEAAARLLNEEKKSEHYINRLFGQEESTPAKEESLITLSQLFGCAKNPLKTYFNQALGLYLREEEALTDEDDFVLNPLEEYQIKTEALTKSLESVLKNAEGRGRLPQGMFGDLSTMKLQDEGENIKSFLTEEGISESDIFSVEFSEHCEEIQQVDSIVWQVPAIRIDQTTIIGTLPWVTRAGLCLYKKSESKDLLESWPKILILNYLCNMTEDKLPIEKQLLLLKTQTKLPCAVSKPDVWLKAFVDYYHHCQTNPSPLLPEWISDIVTGEKFENTLNKSLGNQFKNSFNQYFLFCMRDKQVKEFDAAALEPWKERAFTCIDFDHELLSKIKSKK